jgi:hypothetical protein
LKAPPSSQTSASKHRIVQRYVSGLASQAQWSYSCNWKPFWLIAVKIEATSCSETFGNPLSHDAMSHWPRKWQLRILRFFNELLTRNRLRTGFWWGDLREGDHFGDPGVDGRIILKWIFKRWDGAWTGLSWLKIGTGGGLLWMR